ncbi:MAG TPA: helix-turn-helix transcriptional regulator [Solirubrobacterales bacterium]
MTGAEGITFSTAAERFAWNLRIARCRAMLRQRDLADRMGKDQSAISVWESGRCLPRTHSIVRLAEALEIEPGELLRGTKGLGS